MATVRVNILRVTTLKLRIHDHGAGPIYCSAFVLLSSSKVVRPVRPTTCTEVFKQCYVHLHSPPPRDRKPMKITKQGILWNIESEKAMHTASLDMTTVRHEVVTLKPSVSRDIGKSASRRAPQRQSKRKKEEQHTPCPIQDETINLEAELTRLLEQDDDALVDDLLDEAARAARLLISMSAEDPACDPEAIEVINAGLSEEEKHLESIHIRPNSKLLEEADALATSPSCCGLTNEECLAEAALNVAIGNPDIDDEDVDCDEDNDYQGNNDNADDAATAEQPEMLMAEGRVRGVLKRRLVKDSEA